MTNPPGRLWRDKRTALGGPLSRRAAPLGPLLLLLFFPLIKGRRRSLSLKLSDIRVYAPQIRARLGTTAHFCRILDNQESASGTHVYTLLTALDSRWRRVARPRKSIVLGVARSIVLGVCHLGEGVDDEAVGARQTEAPSTRNRTPDLPIRHSRLNHSATRDIRLRLATQDCYSRKATMGRLLPF